MKITKKLKSKTVAYYLFPAGERRGTLEEVLALRKPGDWVREYTVVCKDILVENGQAVSQASGTYMTSKEIKS